MGPQDEKSHWPLPASGWSAPVPQREQQVRWYLPLSEVVAAAGGQASWPVLLCIELVVLEG